MNKTVLGVTRLKLTAKIFIGLGIVIVLWGVGWLLNQRQARDNIGFGFAFIICPLTALILFGIHRTILKTKMMLRGDSHARNIFAGLLPWFVWAAVGLATWGVNEWFNSRPLSMTSPWDWMSSLVVVGWLGWGCIYLFLVLYVFLNWLRTRQPPYLALISVGIATGLVCGFIGGVVGTAYMLFCRIPQDSIGYFIGPFGVLLLGGMFWRGFISESSASRKLFVRNIWIVYSLWVVMLSSVFLFVLPLLFPFYSGGWPPGGWDTTWIWSAPITGASLGLLGVLIFFLEQSVGDIGLKNQDNARWLSRQSWWYRRRLTEWNPFWFTALVAIPLLSIFLMSVPAVKDLQMIQQVFAEEGSKEYSSRIELLDPACMALKQFELEVDQSPDWKKLGELSAKEKILWIPFAPMTEGQLLLYEALHKEIDEILSKNTEWWFSNELRQLGQESVNSWEDGPLSKQFEQKKSDLQAAKEAAFSKLMAYIWNQCSLGLGVGLVFDVMLLVGVAAWLNIRRSSKFPSSTQ